MSPLHEPLAAKVSDWRRSGYACDDFPALGELLEWACGEDAVASRYLRAAQIRALETYWYLRVVEKTPHVFDLYRRLFKKPAELRKSLGLANSAIAEIVENEGLEPLWSRIREDDAFVRDFRLESLRETLTLDYPSYIFALAMGAGKTVLIGAIVATEFALAIEYPQGPFVQNALVFAPGTTILESLRELSNMPYDRILPPRFFKPFAASVKLTFTRSGEKDIPVTRRSAFNVVVTNTEKIRIQKESIRKADLGDLFNPAREDEARQEVANLRLQTIASLPHLAVFSDEAHHTYGQTLGEELKKVRKTVDYLHAKTNLICVVNTTGTPYFERQPLRDVVLWYGLAEGIRDGILKDPSGNIQAYDFSGDSSRYVSHVVADFFKEYASVKLPNGAKAKLAIYFPQTDDLKALKPVIDAALVKAGSSPAESLINTSEDTLTKQSDIDAFNRLNDPDSPHRVILLVNKGTEGWNCPSLFACALARKLKTSNNFVLQAASRCLRQAPGNSRPARIYLSQDNFGILDRQLQETYGTTIAELNRERQETETITITLRKTAIPPLLVTQTRRTVARVKKASDRLALRKPQLEVTGLVRRTFALADQESTASVLLQTDGSTVVPLEDESAGIYAAAVSLAGCCHVDLWMVYDELKRLYEGEDIPYIHIADLSRQIETQTRAYETKVEKVERALALVKTAGFDKGLDKAGAEVWTAEIIYPRDKERLLLSWESLRERYPSDLSFHDDPYRFDSNPEKNFLEQLLAHLDKKPSDIAEVYFTGGLTASDKTDFFVDYKDLKGKWRRYTPDFIVRTKPGEGEKQGKALIVEIKSEHERAHPIDGEAGRKAQAARKWEEAARETLDRFTLPRFGLLERRGRTRASTYHLAKGIARDLLGKAAYTKIRGVNPARYAEMVRQFVSDHGSITPKECRELLGLGNSASASVEISRYFRKWSAEGGFLKMEGKSPKNQYVPR